MSRIMTVYEISGIYFSFIVFIYKFKLRYILLDICIL